jgi:hypothetical protein
VPETHVRYDCACTAEAQRRQRSETAAPSVNLILFITSLLSPICAAAYCLVVVETNDPGAVLPIRELP